MSLPNQTTIIAVDPGRFKSGIAVVSGPKPVNVLEHSVVEDELLIETLAKVLERHPDTSALIVGNGTGSAAVVRAIVGHFADVKLALVDERGTSELARARFIAQEPLPLLQRMLPLGMRSPNRPYDDYVAILLAERYFKKDA